MVTKEQLIQSMANKLTKQFAEAVPTPFDKDFEKKETLLFCRNTQVIKVLLFSPTEANKTGEHYYRYEFLTVTSPETYDLMQISEKVLQIGYENEDISGSTPEDLMKLGFVTESGTGYCALCNMLRPDNYALEVENEYLVSEPCEADGVMVQNIFAIERLVIYGKTVAKRYTKIGTRPADKS